MKGVFDTRPVTNYEDDVVMRYHFPHRYLEEASKSVGDCIVYREPQRGRGRRGYVAVARLESIEPDASDSGRYYGRYPDSCLSTPWSQCGTTAATAKASSTT